MFTKKECAEWRKKKTMNPLTGRRITATGPTFKRIFKKCEPYECEEWLDKPNFNPDTGRKIKINGPVYKRLKKKCEPTELSDCVLWKKRPTVNPQTGRTIKKGGVTYKKLEKICSTPTESSEPKLLYTPSTPHIEEEREEEEREEEEREEEEREEKQKPTFKSLTTFQTPASKLEVVLRVYGLFAIGPKYFLDIYDSIFCEPSLDSFLNECADFIWDNKKMFEKASDYKILYKHEFDLYPIADLIRLKGLSGNEALLVFIFEQLARRWQFFFKRKYYTWSQIDNILNAILKKQISNESIDIISVYPRFSPNYMPVSFDTLMKGSDKLEELVKLFVTVWWKLIYYDVKPANSDVARMFDYIPNFSMWKDDNMKKLRRAERNISTAMAFSKKTENDAVQLAIELIENPIWSSDFENIFSNIFDKDSIEEFLRLCAPYVLRAKEELSEDDVEYIDYSELYDFEIDMPAVEDELKLLKKALQAKASVSEAMFVFAFNLFTTEWEENIYGYDEESQLKIAKEILRRMFNDEPKRYLIVTNPNDPNIGTNKLTRYNYIMSQSHSTVQHFTLFIKMWSKALFSDNSLPVDEDFAGFVKRWMKA